MPDGQLSTALRYLHRMIGGKLAGARPDRELLERFVQRRDEAAFAVLLDRHGPLVLGVCRRILRDPHDTDDAFQATFLVFVRRAGTIARGESVGSWLYGVATRVALRARAQAQRRRAQEKQVYDMPGTDLPSETNWSELRPILDEEVNRLPEKYRVPFVLCHLEGKSNEEAARQLGCPVGTVWGRLARARERLRTRLAHRGVVLSSAALVTALTQQTASAVVPASLHQSTFHAGLAYLAGQAGGVASASAVALAEGVLPALGWTRLKMAAMLLLAIGMIGTAAVGIFYHPINGGNAPATELSDTSRPIPPVLPEAVRGSKVLIAFDVGSPTDNVHRIPHQIPDIEAALQKSGCRIVERVNRSLYLVDGLQHSRQFLKALPHRQGMLVFEDGRFRESVPYENHHHPGQLLQAEPFACVRGVSGAHSLKAMKQDIARFAQMPGVVAEAINIETGTKTGGESWILKLTPAEGKTLLEVFLQTRAGFYYKEIGR